MTETTNAAEATTDAAVATAQDAKEPPLYRRLKGYAVEGRRAARYAVERGLGVVDFGEPTAGEWDDFQHGVQGGARNVDAMATALKACVRRATGLGWPKPEQDLGAWTKWFRGLPLSAAKALETGVLAFVAQMSDADREDEAGNG